MFQWQLEFIRTCTLQRFFVYGVGLAYTVCLRIVNGGQGNPWPCDEVKNKKYCWKNHSTKYCWQSYTNASRNCACRDLTTDASDGSPALLTWKRHIEPTDSPMYHPRGKEANQNRTCKRTPSIKLNHMFDCKQAWQRSDIMVENKRAPYRFRCKHIARVCAVEVQLSSVGRHIPPALQRFPWGVRKPHHVDSNSMVKSKRIERTI